MALPTVISLQRTGSGQRFGRRGPAGPQWMLAAALLVAVTVVLRRRVAQPR